MTQAQIKEMATVGVAVVKAVSLKDAEEAKKLKEGIEKVYSSSSNSEKAMLDIYLRRLNTLLCPN